MRKSDRDYGGGPMRLIVAHGLESAFEMSELLGVGQFGM